MSASLIKFNNFWHVKITISLILLYEIPVSMMRWKGMMPTKTLLGVDSFSDLNSSLKSDYAFEGYSHQESRGP